MKQTLYIVIISVLVSGCVARTYYTPYRILPSSTAERDIKVFYPGDKLPKKWTPVGSMRVDGWYFTPETVLLRGALKHARKKGGDAIIVGEFGDVQASTVVPFGGSPGNFSGIAATDGDFAAVGMQYTAPIPPSYVPITVAWPAMSALVIKWVD